MLPSSELAPPVHQNNSQGCGNWTDQEVTHPFENNGGRGRSSYAVHYFGARGWEADVMVKNMG